MLSFESETDYKAWLGGTNIPKTSKKIKTVKNKKILPVLAECSITADKVEFVFNKA